MEDKNFLDKEGLKEVFKLLQNTFTTKVDSDKLIALTIDEYNDLGNNIDEDAYYFLIDKDDDIFDRIKQLENRLEEAENFINQFPNDNRTYGIINKYPKYLNIKELDSDPRGEASTDTSGEEPNI